jgi:hypothetical protein
MTEDLCEQMPEMHHSTDHGEDCPIAGAMSAEKTNGKYHHSLNKLGLACACNIEEAPLKTEAPIYQKIKSQVFVVVQVLVENHTPNNEFDTHSYTISDSYSPPPLYIINETFLI